jgi:hypothetical protein
MSESRLRRRYVVEIDFDTPIDKAEQDRRVCMVLEDLVSDYWASVAPNCDCYHEPEKVIATVAPDSGR